MFSRGLQRNYHPSKYLVPYWAGNYRVSPEFGVALFEAGTCGCEGVFLCSCESERMSLAVSAANHIDIKAPAPDKAPKNKRCPQPSTPKMPFNTSKHIVRTGSTIADAKKTERESRSGYSPSQGTSSIPGVTVLARKFLKSTQK